MPNRDKPNANGQLLRYAGLTMQMLALLFAGIWAGRWFDAKTGLKFPLFSFCLPLILIIGLLLQVVRETGKKK